MHGWPSDCAPRSSEPTAPAPDRLLGLGGVPDAALSVAVDLAGLLVVLVGVEGLAAPGPLHAAVRALDDREVAARLVARGGLGGRPGVGALTGAGRLARLVLVVGVEGHALRVSEHVARLRLLLLERAIVLGPRPCGGEAERRQAGGDGDETNRSDAHERSPLLAGAMPSPREGRRTPWPNTWTLNLFRPGPREMAAAGASPRREPC